MKKLILVILLFAILAGCSHFEGYTYGPGDLMRSSGQRKDIRIGHFYTGMYRKAFFDEWGYPEKTLSMSSEEYSNFSSNWSGNWGGATYFRGRAPLDVWVYESKKTVVVFHGRGLVGWSTGDEALEILRPKKVKEPEQKQ